MVDSVNSYSSASQAPQQFNQVAAENLQAATSNFSRTPSIMPGGCYLPGGYPQPIPRPTPFPMPQNQIIQQLIGMVTNLVSQLTSLLQRFTQNGPLSGLSPQMPVCKGPAILPGSRLEQFPTLVEEKKGGEKKWYEKVWDYGEKAWDYGKKAYDFVTGDGWTKTKDFFSGLFS